MNQSQLLEENQAGILSQDSSRYILNVKFFCAVRDDKHPLNYVKLFLIEDGKIFSSGMIE